MRRIVTIKIHPAIGIARVGNSPSEFFVGPEAPDLHTRPRGGYKDEAGRVKRQAARFRLFGYDDKGHVVREITASEASTTWVVHLANRKAAWRRFEGLDPTTPWRNASVADRQSLIVDPGSAEPQRTQPVRPSSTPEDSSARRFRSVRPGRTRRVVSWC